MAVFNLQWQWNKEMDKFQCAVRPAHILWIQREELKETQELLYLALSCIR